MAEKLSNEHIKDIIIDLERRYPVDEWVVNDIHIWPYLRNKIYIYLLNYNVDIFFINKPALSKNKKGLYFILNKAKIPFKMLKALFSLSSFFYFLKPKKIIFFGSHFHRVLHKEVYFNRFFDSMVDYHKLQEEVYLIESKKVHKNLYNQKAVIPLNKYLDQYKLLLKISKILFQKKPQYSLKSYEVFFEELNSNYKNVGNLKIAKNEIINWANKIDYVKGFFLRIYGKVTPSKILMLSYNGFDDLSAAILAAHLKGIKTIDFQHGFQTNVHMVYSYWTKIPKNSYNIMPTEYWNWDLRSKQNIEKWSKKVKTLSAIVVGQPYLGYWYEIEKRIKNKQRNVFYSLGVLSLAEMFPEMMLNIIRNSSFQWIFRLHPRSNIDATQIMSYLISKNVNEGNFSIQDAFRTPLPRSLAKSLIHITNFSGCLIEAQIMGIPSLIIHRSGREFFKDYIDNYLVYYVDITDPEFEKSYEDIIAKICKIDFQTTIIPVANPLNADII